MDAIDALEADLADDPYTPLREHLALNDDQLLEDLVAMRKAKRLTQDEVAARMNRSKTAVSNFERLGADPHLSTIRRYAAAVGGKVNTRLSDFDEELDERAAAETLSVSVRKSDSPAKPERGPIGVWELV
ncbi:MULTISPECIES: helix-turn-helix domain-containing protein [unclassified Gordonia (in: high G+C Gram-positive bacteria)]|uniref:helix-turn-helix domain-containing protein n=1 Tax=unclassified Gordonia (in: high G+C Gram-positive bacteria) TaxID=2657482 RepID=UPI001CFA3274|nr:MULTISPECIES: helix-turn-helix transcriptional regulator [unclassified Gordonia (in: high G+C Gram-positive bacteria)]MCT1353836.1 helix-turn-helix domain-containing protein [Gordonia sp. p3-SID1431]UCZ91264.1 helix-turn-helix domain-containing protein [Gordonia sp. WA4-43]